MGPASMPRNQPRDEVWHGSCVAEIREATVAELAARARVVGSGSPRVLIGIAGAPGAGKSTLATRLAEQLGSAAVVVAMDGFHLAQAELDRLGIEDRKGAPDTFDAGGYVALLRRLRDPHGATIYAPTFRRDIEEPIANAVAVPPGVRYVVTEGNYLLLDELYWRDVRSLLDETWFLDVDATHRQQRLLARRVALGMSEEDARPWVFGSDERNAELVERTRGRADLIVHLADAGG